MATYTLNQRFAVAKLESSPGVMETPTASDFNARLRNIEITPNIEWADDASKFANGSHGEDEDIAGAQSASISFQIRMGIGDTITAAPNYAKYLNACGLSDVAYSAGRCFRPLKAFDVKTLTIWVYDIETGGATPGGLLYKFAGCMGNVVIGQDGIGKPLVGTFTFTGKCIDIVDVAYAAIPEGMDFDQAHPEKALNQTLTFGAVAQKVSSWSLDVGNEVSPLINQGDITGYDYYQITNRKPRLSANPIMTSVATEDVWGNAVSGLTGTQAIFVTGMGLTGGNIGLKIPKAQRVQNNVANREGIMSWDSQWRLLANGWTGALADSTQQAESTFEILYGARG